jgi:hypothetical protein
MPYSLCEIIDRSDENNVTLRVFQIDNTDGQGLWIHTVWCFVLSQVCAQHDKMRSFSTLQLLLSKLPINPRLSSRRSFFLKKRFIYTYVGKIGNILSPYISRHCHKLIYRVLLLPVANHVAICFTT